MNNDQEISALAPMTDFIAKVVGQWNKAIEVCMLEFAERNGIELPAKELAQVDPVAFQQKIGSLVELVVMQPPLSVKEVGVLLVAWCIDRRDGKRDYEQTFPYAQVSMNKNDAGQFYYHVEIMDKGEPK